MRIDTLREAEAQGRETGSLFVPITFESLLHFLYMKENREHFSKSISDSENYNAAPISEKSTHRAEIDMSNFVNLLGVADVETTDYSIARKYLYNHEIALKSHNQALKRKLA